MRGEPILSRANVYIDGFNLYYGALKGTPYKWLDLRALCERLLPRFEIQLIRYFTARIKSRKDDPSQAQRQQIYLRALSLTPGLEVHYGRYLTSKRRAPLANPPERGPRTVEILHTEEKGSDVNLASYLLPDGFRGGYDVAFVVSNDSDLVHPIELVRSHLDLHVGVINPHGSTPSWALKKAAASYRTIRPSALRQCQLPDELEDARGAVRKPSAWMRSSG